MTDFVVQQYIEIFYIANTTLHGYFLCNAGKILCITYQLLIKTVCFNLYLTQLLFEVAVMGMENHFSQHHFHGCCAQMLS